MYKYSAKVDRVVDGDTVDALVDLGFDTWKKVRIRMVGINTPESRTRDLEEKKRGLAAKDRLIELLGDGYFILQSHGVGKYGRCLGELFVKEININQQLITEGHAVEYYGGAR
ncbi:thermonuclease family protein [bacterium]|nr:thermonuclease family protein [bacterium]